MELIFDCNDYVVLVKEAGIISESNGKDGLPDLLMAEYGGEFFAVHRLDKSVSGLMVYARNKSAAANLSAQIQGDKFRKTYLAICHGTLEEKEGTMVDLLFKDKVKLKSYVVKRERKGVRRAELTYKVLREFTLENQPASLVEVALKTGRFHQIRAQFASRKHPLFGDRRYGAKDGMKTPALFCVGLEFESPSTGERVQYQWQPPLEIQ